MVAVPGLRNPAGARVIRELRGLSGSSAELLDVGGGRRPGRRRTPRVQVYRSPCRRREAASGPEQTGPKVRSGNGVQPGVPEASLRTSFWTTLGLVRAEVGPLYLYYGESGEPSTFDPAGNIKKHWKPAHLRAEARTFEGNTYGSEP